ncbi:DinB family protein [Clostridium manihotivorum]|uniref:DinB superfamily protein n=1 Tax=Clostridium manihotivorum TaxID=2320868 RepID=A0A3R5QV43_9CLOT|nr:DinB family protein [Clostridium manihotivorum]QAA33359.1 hypothetical protein C1I91_17845 [Clostridium manihotivorum]
MDTKKGLWNLNQKKLREMLSKPTDLASTLRLCLEQHSMVHSSQMSHINHMTFEDELWDDLDDIVFRTATNEKGRTIAYGLWHCSRIEDITMNILVAESSQVINQDNFLMRIRSSICDTGNQLSPEEILIFSSYIDMEELRNYRIAVGRRSNAIISSLTASDLKRKFNKASIDRILDEKAVADVPSANWLIDFWARKNVAGILLMPATRHHMVHLSESMNAKSRYRKTRDK